MSGKHSIYFSGSISGGRQDAELYLRIVTQLKSYGTVLTEHVASPTVEAVLVAEVTQPSLGVGYEIGRAVALNKTIICLFRPDSGKKLSAMISGAVGKNFHVYNYKEEQVPEILAKHLK